MGFSKDFGSTPEHPPKNGVVVLDDKKIIHSYPLMWIEALELLFESFNNDKIPLTGTEYSIDTLTEHAGYDDTKGRGEQLAEKGDDQHRPVSLDKLD